MTHAHVIRPRNLMWLPAALLMTWGVLAAAGVPLSPNSKAASSATSNVTANVLGSINVAGTCDDATTTGGLTVNADDTSIGAACTVTVNTTDNLNGAQLRAESDRPTGSVALCQNATTTATCGAVANFTDGPTTGIADLADGAFGLRPTSTTNCTVGANSWVANTTYGLPADADATPGGAASSSACRVPMSTTGTLTLNYRADTLAAQTSGNYYASVIWFGEAL